MTALSIEERERELDSLLESAVRALAEAADADTVEAVRVRYLGRSGELVNQFSVMREGSLSAEQKQRLGRKLNAVKQALEESFSARRAQPGTLPAGAGAPVDLSLPGHLPRIGRHHPLTQTLQRIVEIFRSFGFSVVDGPEIETEHNNFEALNIPPEHPSRENFDTFYLEKQDLLLRSHTSPVQIRFMEQHPPPLRIIVPGRVYRPDAVDATHCFQFHQVEGLAVAPGTTFGDLKGVLVAWAEGMFGSSARLRFRPHHFPFTEPSAEGDLACIFCEGKGCRVCGQKGWLEILGCGMVHPEVFRAVGYPPGTVGFAFGMGVERIAMLLNGIEDIRFFFENDLRFLRQFP